MHRAVHLVTALTLVVAMVVLTARSEPAPSLAMRADIAFQSQHWQEAAQLYRKIVDANPKDATSYFRLGYALVKLGRDGEARALFKSGEQHGLPRPTAELGQALALVRSDRSQALT